MSRGVENDGHRQRPLSWWRPVCVILALLLLAVPLVPFAHLVGFTVGSWALFVHAAGPPIGGRPAVPAWGTISMTFGGPHAVIRNEAGQEYVFAGPVIVHCVRAAGWGYYVAWGKGRRTR
jgi:hypothetical protein